MINMEPTPVFKSRTKFFSLTNLDNLIAYCGLLEKCYNNKHKYNIVDNEIKVDSFGDPYVIFQYYEKEGLDERIKSTASFFGEIFPLKSDLERYDTLVNDHNATNIQITFINDYTTKDKINPFMYRLVIYFKIAKNETVDSEAAKNISPLKKDK